ncbi:DUF1080 domain-containing protein [Kribbella sp. NPDC026611]|uniref:DUF1080 domain-containing protein n=1 Tax=Kribbella sp. NPDC026611 TaxID=3154911 RepID=UPI0033CC42C8
MLSRRTSKLVTLLLCVSALVAGSIVPAGAYTIAAPYTFSLSAPTPVEDFGDGEFTVVKDGTDLYVIGLVSPSSAPPQTPRIFKGTSMDNLVRQPDGALDSSYPTDRGDRYWWNAGAYVDASGKWYVPTHVEFSFPGNGLAPLKRIGLSTSTDKGRHWHYEGDILTSDNSYTFSDFHNYYDYGVGEPALYVDTAGGFFYVWYMNTWFSTTDNGEFESSLRVARAPISGKMAPGTWQYLYNGAWSEPGLGGRASDLLPNASGVTVAFNTSLQKFVLISSKLYSRHAIEDGAYMATATDLSLQNWTGFHKISDQLDHYNVITTSDGTGVGTVGSTMRVYSGGFEGGCCHWVRRTMTFGAGSQQALGMAEQHLPRYSINDGNPYWDWDATPRPTSYSDNFNDGVLTGWKTYNGAWSEAGGTLSVDSGSGNRAAIEDKWFDDFTFDADVQATTPTGNAGVVFRNASNDYGTDNYRGYYVGFDGSQLVLGRADNSSGVELNANHDIGDWTPLQTAAVNGAPNVFHHLRIVAHSARIQVFFDNATTPAIDAVDSAFSFGGIGVRTFNTAAKFDNVSVTRNTTLNAYTLSDNLSTTQGTKGWRYQQLNGGTYTDLTWNQQLGQWKGSAPYNLVWVPSWIHPDQNATAVSWTAPTSGPIVINGAPRKESAAGDGVDLRIMKNSTQIWPAGGVQHLTGTSEVAHSVKTTVAAGDVIHFVVDKSGTNTSDATLWNPTIEYSSGPPIGQVIWLRAASNGLNVVARADETDAPLKAKSTQLGNWEKFQVLDAGAGFIALKALSNNRNVVAWASVTGNPLRANSDVLGDWEKLQWIDVGNGSINLKANSNGKYVVARADESESPLRANSDVQGDWEKYSWGRYLTGIS